MESPGDLIPMYVPLSKISGRPLLSNIVTLLEIRGKVQTVPEGRCDAPIGHGAKAPCYA